MFNTWYSMILMLLKPKMKTLAATCEEKTNRMKHIPSVQTELIQLLKFFNSQTFHNAILYLEWHFFQFSIQQGTVNDHICCFQNTAIILPYQTMITSEGILPNNLSPNCINKTVFNLPPMRQGQITCQY